MAYDIGKQLLARNSDKPVPAVGRSGAKLIVPKQKEENSQEIEPSTIDAAEVWFKQIDAFEAWLDQMVRQNKVEISGEAIASYDRAIAIKFDDYSAWYKRGVALGQLERYEEAIASYDRAIAIIPNE